MNKKIELTIEDNHHNSTVLTNEKGDTFTFDPMINAGLSDFLSGGKVLPIDDVSKSLAKLIQEQDMSAELRTYLMEINLKLK